MIWLARQKLICLWLLLSSKVRLVFQSYIRIYSCLFLFHFLDLLKFPLLNPGTDTDPSAFLTALLSSFQFKTELKYPGTSKCVGGWGFIYYNDYNTFPQECMVPTCKVFQRTANELSQEHQNYMKTHFHDH